MGWRQSENNSFLRIWLKLRVDNMLYNKRDNSKRK